MEVEPSNMCALLWGVLALVCSVRCEGCVAPKSSSGRFSLVSRRNATGHWTAQIRVEHSGDDSLGPWEVDVEHNTAICGDSETVSILATIAAPPSRATAGYELFPTVGYYKLHTEGRVWKDALKTCAREGAHLAIINSETEANVLKNLFALHPKISNSSDQNHAFLGYHDLYKEGDFVTVLGKPLNGTGFLRWSDGTQPNNAKSGPDPDSDCGGMHRNGGLNDLPCNWKVAFFCEQEL